MTGFSSLWLLKTWLRSTIKVDFDMIFRLNAAEKMVAEHYIIEFYMIFHFKAAQNLVAEHSEFSTLRWIKTLLKSTMKYNFDIIFPIKETQKMVAEHYMKEIST